MPDSKPTGVQYVGGTSAVTSTVLRKAMVPGLIVGALVGLWLVFSNKAPDPNTVSGFGADASDRSTAVAPAGEEMDAETVIAKVDAEIRKAGFSAWVQQGDDDPGILEVRSHDCRQLQGVLSQHSATIVNAFWSVQCVGKNKNLVFEDVLRYQKVDELDVEEDPFDNDEGLFDDSPEAASNTPRRRRANGPGAAPARRAPPAGRAPPRRARPAAGDPDFAPADEDDLFEPTENIGGDGSTPRPKPRPPRSSTRPAPRSGAPVAPRTSPPPGVPQPS